MDTQETIENNELATEFQKLLIQELQACGVRFTKATAVNFSDVNIDVNIYIEDWDMPLFKYIGIGRLKNREIGWFKDVPLSETTLSSYVKDYVDRELKELKSSVEYVIEQNADLLARDTQWSDNYKQSLEQRLDSARKIASWLA